MWGMPLISVRRFLGLHPSRRRLQREVSARYRPEVDPEEVRRVAVPVHFARARESIGERRRRERPAKKISLQVPHPSATQRFRGRLRVSTPFGHDVQSELLADRDDHADKVLGRAVAQVAHERLVDLDRVERQVLDDRQRRVARAEIVQRDAHAERT